MSGVVVAPKVDPRDPRLRLGAAGPGYRGEIYPRLITGSAVKDYYWHILMRQLNGRVVIIPAVLRPSDKIGGWAAFEPACGLGGRIYVRTDGRTE